MPSDKVKKLKQLTPKRRKIYDWIERYTKQHNQAPTIAEMADAFKMSNPGIIRHLVALKKWKLIEKLTDRTSRCWVPTGVRFVRKELSSTR